MTPASAPPAKSHRLLAIALFCTWLFTAPLAGAQTERIVAVGDIHGAFDQLVTLLRRVDLIDEENRWTGGSAILVQTGDMLDRGPGVRQVMDLLMNLQEEATARGGRVEILLGNHETMNLTGDLRYLTAETCAAFVDERSQERRLSAYREWTQWKKRRAEVRGEKPPELGQDTQEQWMADHPIGLVEYLEAIGPAGTYGRWLRQLPVAVKLQETIFIHGGISPALAHLTLSELTKEVQQEIKTFDRHRKKLIRRGFILPTFDLLDILDAVRRELLALQNNPGSSPLSTSDRRLLIKAYQDLNDITSWLIYREDGPVWFRGFTSWPENGGEGSLSFLLGKYRASRFVAAHTPTRPPGQIEVRFDGRLFLIDTGMLPGYYPGGRGSALEIHDGTLTAVYSDERQVLKPEPEAQPDTSSPPPPAPGAPLAARGHHRRTALAAFPSSAAASATSEEVAHDSKPRWLDADGAPLPFSSHDEAVTFLRNADVVSVEDIPRGSTQPKKLLLAENGIRAHAVFRYPDEERTRVRLTDGTWVTFFRDSYLSEAAAYEMSLLLDMDNVPPTVQRNLMGRPGSVQLWIEDAMTELGRQNRDIEPPDRLLWNQHFLDMAVFDNLINNTDRNLGNVLIDSDWNVWLIDHTRAFARDKKLPYPERVSRCSRHLWQRLKALDEETLRRHLRPLLSRAELAALVHRHRLLVELIQKRIDNLGEDRVLFTYGEAGGQVEIHYDESPPPADGGSARQRLSPSALPAVVGGRLRAGFVVASAEASDQEAPAATSVSAEIPRWLDADGEPLPFDTLEEVEEFLQTARVISEQEISRGITRPRRLLLEKNGRRAHAVFRYLDVTHERVRLADGTFHMHLRDSYIGDVAAYRLSRLLGMDNVPPAVTRELHGTNGSLQLWLENTMLEAERREQGLEPPDRLAWNRQLYDMAVFDNLVANVDRNLGNILVDGSWRVWLIDHTRAFQRQKRLPYPERVLKCSRRLWAAIKRLNEDLLEDQLRSYLGKFEIAALVSRRQHLIELIEERIAKRGEERVLFTYGAPSGDIQFQQKPVLPPPGLSGEANLAPCFRPGVLARVRLA